MVPYLGYKLHPDIHYSYMHRGAPEVLEVDSLGFVHNGDPSANVRLSKLPADQIYRIVLFGGSTMAGQNSGNNSHTIPAYFERLVRTEWPEASVQVINAGVFGYNSTNERLRYELEFRRQWPGMVIFLDGYNDASVPMLTPDWHPHKSVIGLTQKDYLTMFSPAGSFLAWTGNLLRFPEPLATLAVARRLRDRLIPASVRKVTDAPYHAEAGAVFEDNMAAIVAQANAIKGRAIFALQPTLPLGKKPLSENEAHLLTSLNNGSNHPTILSRYYEDFTALWVDMSRRFDGDNIQFIDLTSAFQDMNQHIYDDIVHYGPPGNERLALLLFEAARGGIGSDLATHGYRRSGSARE